MGPVPTKKICADECRKQGRLGQEGSIIVLKAGERSRMR